MDDWEKYEKLADTPKYRDDFEFAMYGATHFGMKAIPILATAPTYGDKYPELIKQACETTLSRGGHFGRITDIDDDFIKRADLGGAVVRLKELSSFCDQRITEIKAERLMEKLEKQVKPKSETRQQSMKMKI